MVFLRLTVLLNLCDSCFLQNPVVFHFDFDQSGTMMSFDSFLSKFEHMIINTIIENRAKLLGEDKTEALRTLQKVALRFYDKNLLEQNMAHSINRVLQNPDGHTYAYSLDTSKCEESADKLR